MTEEVTETAPTTKPPRKPRTKPARPRRTVVRRKMPVEIEQKISGEWRPILLDDEEPATSLFGNTAAARAWLRQHGEPDSEYRIISVRWQGRLVTEQRPRTRLIDAKEGA